MEKTELAFKSAEFHTRKLCEEVLVRDSSEMVLGKMYSWDSLNTEELAIKALTSLRHFNAERTDLLRKLLDVSEERRMQIESLTEQIEVFKNHVQTSDQSSKDGEYIVDDNYMVIEEDKDIQEVDVSDVAEISALAQELQPVQREIPVHQAKKMIREQEKISKDRSMVHVIDLSEYSGKITELMWMLIEIVGKEGISSYTEIESRVQKLSAEPVTKAMIRMSVRSINSMNIFSSEQISDPLRSKFLVYRFTEIGHRLFKEHFGYTAVLSELDRIISQHDNANHGYGIRALASILTDSKKFESVCFDSIKNKRKLQRGAIYIPDIVAVSNGKEYFFEYECGTHMQPDFSAKCNKMLQMTSCLNIVTPNRDVLQKRIVPQVKTWMKEKGGFKALSGKTVRLTTAMALRNENPLDDQCWQVVFNMKTAEPSVKF